MTRDQQWAAVVQQSQRQTQRQHEKRDARIAELARHGVKASAADLNGARIGAKEMDLFIRLLKQEQQRKAKP